MKSLIYFTSKIDSQLWLLFVLSIFVWVPLLQPAYFFNAHDSQHSIFYLVEFDQTWRDGYLWPRWSPDFAFGYGYPLFNIYAPLAIYFAEIIHLLGASMVSSIKTVYVFATIGSGLTMYGFVQRLFGKNAGLLAGVVYMYAPFHLVEIYVRSAYAEYVSLALLPLVLWMFTELTARPNMQHLALAGGSYGLLALTHHTSFFTFTPFLIIYIVALIIGKITKESQSYTKNAESTTFICLKDVFLLAGFNLGAGILGIALAGIYLVPVIFERQYIQVEQWTSESYTFWQHFVYGSQFLSPFWGYGYAGIGLADDMSYQIGIVIYGLLVFAFICLIGMQNKHVPHFKIFFVAVILSMWLMTAYAETFWQIIPITELIQFPWRLLIITTLCASVVIGALVATFSDEISTIFLLCIIFMLGSYSYTKPQYTHIPDMAETPLAVINWDSESVKDRVGMVIDTQVQPTTSPMENQYRTGTPLQVATVLSGTAHVETIRHGGASDEIHVISNGATIQFFTYNFPGWQVFLNGELIPHHPEPPYGLITVDIPSGEHTVLLKMGTTLHRTVGSILSLVALIMIIGLVNLNPQPFPCYEWETKIPISLWWKDRMS